MSNSVSSEAGAKKNKKTGLGRGLGSLLGGGDEGSFSKSVATEVDLSVESSDAAAKAAPEESLKAALKQAASTVTPQVPDAARIWNISIEQIKPHSKQPRKDFAKEALQELSQSIREKGILQPIVARRTKDGAYQIIAGERRWRAAQLAGLQEVPVLLKESSDQDSLELALIENIQREDLNPIEEAQAYSYLMKEYGLTQQELAVKVGKERATIANVVRLLNLAPEVRQWVLEGKISLGQAKVLLSINDYKLQKALAQKVMQLHLSVRATEKLVAQAQQKNVTVESDLDEAARLAQQAARSVREELQKIMGTKVSIDYSAGKGKLEIHFYSDEELNQLIARFRKSWQS